MILAVILTTWIQLGGGAVALLAALAAWAGVKQARDAAREVRDSEREARLPLLLLSTASVGTQQRGTTLALAIYNVGDVAVDVAVILLGEDAQARGPVVSCAQARRSISAATSLERIGQELWRSVAHEMGCAGYGITFATAGGFSVITVRTQPGRIYSALSTRARALIDSGSDRSSAATAFSRAT